MKKDIVVCLFDTSGVMGEPWRAAGFRVIRLDLFNDQQFRIPEPGESVAVQADLLKGVPEEMMRPEFLERVAFVAALYALHTPGRVWCSLVQGQGSARAG